MYTFTIILQPILKILIKKPFLNNYRRLKKHQTKPQSNFFITDVVNVKFEKGIHKKGYILGTSHQACLGRRHSADSPEAEAVRAPYATGRRPTAAAAVARATCTAEPYGRGLYIVFHRPQRSEPRGTEAHPFILALRSDRIDGRPHTRAISYRSMRPARACSVQLLASDKRRGKYFFFCVMIFAFSLVMVLPHCELVVWLSYFLVCGIIRNWKLQ